MERLPGFRDFYPEPLPNNDLWSAAARQHIFNHWRDTARRYGFLEYDGPPLEPLELFTLKSGEEILGQLYNFKDKGERDIALRPEMTPTLARMVAAHVRHYKKPLKWFAIPQLFRYERQQKGRLREHFQFNADILGETDPASDAELIALLIDSLRSLGLSEEDFFVRVSSRDAWHEFFATRGGKESDAYAFYQIIDKLERENPEQSATKLKSLGFDLDEVRGFIEEARATEGLEAILGNLRSRGLEPFIQIDYGVIRGLAYYTGVVFEAFDRKGEFRAIAGGGRYDNLIKLVSHGKVDLPALGFGMGDVVLLELLRSRGMLPDSHACLDLYFLIEDEALRNASLACMQKLREAGWAVDYPLTRTKPDKQFKRALELGARFTASLTDPIAPQTVRVKQLRTREEATVPLQDLPDWMRAHR